MLYRSQVIKGAADRVHSKEDQATRGRGEEKNLGKIRVVTRHHKQRENFNSKPERTFDLTNDERFRFTFIDHSAP